MASSTGKALLKPFQLIGISAIFGVFVVLIFLLALQNLVLGLIAGGTTFIISTVVLAMLVLSYRPNAEVPVYLDRFQADSTEPGAKESALKVDPDAALSGGESVRADADGDAGHDGDDAAAGAMGETDVDGEASPDDREQPRA